MEIGLNALPEPAEERYWKDLGVSWCKWPIDITEPDVDKNLRRLEYARSLGLRVCVDLRTSSEWLTLAGLRAYECLLAKGKLQPVPDDVPLEERDPIIKANQAASNAGVIDIIGEHIAVCVSAFRDVCEDWEWWGEWDCPHTSQGIFHLVCYPATLQAAYRTVKQVQPGGRVWTGGNGMDLHDGWLVALRQDGVLKAADCINWHPYPMTLRNRYQIEERLERMYTDWREILVAEGNNQPYGSTEWGYPSLGRATRRQRRWLESNVVDCGISQLYPEEALEHYVGDLGIMERHGFEVVMVHTLRDTGTRHWGAKAGLLTLPPPGLGGRLQRTLGLEKKPIYKLVKEWAAKGRNGRAAFSSKGAGSRPST